MNSSGGKILDDSLEIAILKVMFEKEKQRDVWAGDFFLFMLFFIVTVGGIYHIIER